MRRILGQIRGWSGPDRRSSAACLARSAVCAVTKSPDGEVRLVPRAPAFFVPSVCKVFARSAPPTPGAGRRASAIHWLRRGQRRR